MSNLQEKHLDAINKDLFWHNIDADSKVELVNKELAVKECTRITLQFSVDEFKRLDEDMCNRLFKGRPDLGITEDNCRQTWNRTEWHQMIASKISELEQQIKQLDQ